MAKTLIDEVNEEPEFKRFLETVLYPPPNSWEDEYSGHIREQLAAWLAGREFERRKHES